MKGKRFIAVVMAGLMLLLGQPVVQAEEYVGNVEKNTLDDYAQSIPVEESIKVTLGDSGSFANIYSYEIDQETYSAGIDVISKDNDICSIATQSYYNGRLMIRFQPNQIGETDITVQQRNGNILKIYHVSVVPKSEMAIVYIGNPRVLETNIKIPSDAVTEEWTISNNNADFCEAEFFFEDNRGEGEKTGMLRLEGLVPGNVVIEIEKNGIVQFVADVTVKEMPDDVIKFNDYHLQNALCGVLYSTGNAPGTLDTDSDGYIMKSELEKVQFLLNNPLRNAAITDLTGFEYATNLQEIDLSGNTELKNVDSLYQLDNLTYINVSGTAVSGEDILNLMRFQDGYSITKGNIEKLYTVDVSYDGYSFAMKVIKGKDNIIVQDPDNMVFFGSALGQECGDAIVRISCGDYDKDLHIQVEGIDDEQPLSGAYTNDEIVSVGYTGILDNTQRLWQTYPETILKRENVKQYVSGWVYGIEHQAKCEYALDEDGILWNTDTKIMENIQQVERRYALTNDKKLLDIYDDNLVQIEDVSKWSENWYVWNGKRRGVSYALKTDGSLWRRFETDKGDGSTKFEKIAENVRDIFESKSGDGLYLLEDGTLMRDDLIHNGSDPSQGLQSVELENLKELPHWSFYKTLDGETYIGDFDMIKEYHNIGRADVIDAVIEISNNYDTSYYLTSQGQLFSFSESTGSQLVADDVEAIVADWQQNTIVYRGKDGLYRTISGEVGTTQNPVKIPVNTNLSNCYLEDCGIKDDYNLSLNGAILLDHVKNVIDNNEDAIFLTRVDGTVWKIGYINEGEEYRPDYKIGIPEKIIGLRTDNVDLEMKDAQKEGALSDISSADRNTTVTIAMESAVILPAEILKAAQEKDVTLECTLSNGTKWTIGCGELKSEQLVDTDLTVIKTSKENGSISADAITELAGIRDAEQLNFTDGGVDLAASISLAMDSAFANTKCVAVDLKEETAKLLGVAMISDGQMTLALSQAKDCALVYGLNGDTSADGRVNITDLMQTLHHVSGRTVFGVVEQGISDVNLNGRTDITDLMQMLHYTSGRNETL